jgi:hypothetical protein
MRLDFARCVVPPSYEVSGRGPGGAPAIFVAGAGLGTERPALRSDESRGPRRLVPNPEWRSVELDPIPLGWSAASRDGTSGNARCGSGRDSRGLVARPSTGVGSGAPACALKVAGVAKVCENCRTPSDGGSAKMQVRSHASAEGGAPRISPKATTDQRVGISTLIWRTTNSLVAAPSRRFPVREKRLVIECGNSSQPRLRYETDGYWLPSSVVGSSARTPARRVVVGSGCRQRLQGEEPATSEVSDPVATALHRGAHSGLIRCLTHHLRPARPRARGRIRTDDLTLTRRLLWPAELLGRRPER